MKRLSGLVLLAALILSSAALAETRYVSDQFEITMRRGPSTQNAIVRMLPSGTALDVLDQDAASGYTKVALKSGNAEGYVLTRYLMTEADARSQLAALTARLATIRDQSGDLGRELDDLRQSNAAANQRIASLEQNNLRLSDELSALQKKASNVINIDRENKTLRQELTDTQISLQAVEEENRDLSSSRIMQWFLIGAGVLFAGIVVGLVAPRIRWRKRGGYGGNDFL